MLYPNIPVTNSYINCLISKWQHLPLYTATSIKFEVNESETFQKIFSCALIDLSVSVLKTFLMDYRLRRTGFNEKGNRKDLTGDDLKLLRQT